MTINQAVTSAKRILEKHTELKNWKVTTNKRKRAFGVCNYTYRQIELSEYKVPDMTDAAILDTIAHEIAHALTPGHNHDRIWQLKCIELGGDGKRVHGAEKFKGGEEGMRIAQEKQAKYTLVCPVCGAKYFLNRKPSNSKSCGKHGRGYNEMYKLTVTQNY